MPEETQSQVNIAALAEKIHVSLARADSYTKRNQRLNSTLMIVTIFGSALTAFLTGLTALEGPVVIPGLLEWKGACTVGSILSLVTAITSGLSQQMNISEKLIEGTQCAGRLRALELLAETQSRSIPEITSEYADILRTYGEVTR